LAAPEYRIPGLRAISKNKPAAMISRLRPENRPLLDLVMADYYYLTIFKNNGSGFNYNPGFPN
jgi:hypothetical protein